MPVVVGLVLGEGGGVGGGYQATWGLGWDEGRKRTNPSYVSSPLPQILCKASDLTPHVLPRFSVHCANIMGLFVTPPFALFSLVDLPIEVSTFL